ncbi:phospholipase D family protein [Pseudosulfitobacter koreensis]|uniref:Phospholipase D family protein n=1 Tax=Pseudosulfitobacter koreensis TaxID=2968472 RepID=A0ABT1Z1G3_9RHOB|nr:phospholipase D family protein [Pseudosulfitobacter koreense]MCR8826957.1 phospholipase D family protein [Pseudosulfitobacter koreense]
MKAKFLDASQLSKRLKKLINKHESISIAVAWGHLTPVAKTLLRNKSKFESVLFGLDFSASDPDLIDLLVDVPNAFVAKNRLGCFHPKIYYFQTGKLAEAIIGSANFTRGGLGENFEANIYIRGNTDSTVFEEIRNQLAAYKRLRSSITKELAASYRLQAKAASKKPRPKNPVFPNERDQWNRLNSKLATMSWSDFSERARKDKHHDYAKRIELVRAIQSMFAKSGSFMDLSVAERKGVAGLLRGPEATEAKLEGYDWGWFGSMNRATVFLRAIERQELGIAKALDQIPKRGDITRHQFEKYVDTFRAALAAGDPIGTATRLIAMKRPDLFVCVDGPNKKGLAKALNFSPSTLSLDNYWDRIIEPVRQAPWYNSERPSGPDMELWDARVAMLDAIFYSP